MRILNVDDNMNNRYLAETLLKGHGHEVVSAANGSEALGELESTAFDLVISDILMPVMDGFQLCRAIRADERLNKIPFIFYTATYTGPQDEEFAMKLGADRFVLKPCEPELFIEIIHEVINTAASSRIEDADPTPPEEEVLKLYSERLVRKLEMKMQELEQEAKARQHAEDVIRQSEKRYRALYNSIREAIVVSNTEGIIEDCNLACMELFGYSLDEISGRETTLIFQDEEEYRRISNDLANRDNNSTHLYTVQLKKKDGQLFSSELRVFFLRNEDGKTIGYVGLIRDLTERLRVEKKQRDLEMQLYQAQKLESVGRLAGGVAHDYNNMLTVIVGYSEMALAKLDSGNPLYQDLEAIHKAAVRSSDITRQLLAFARKQAIVPVPLNLNMAVENTINMLRRLIGEDIELAWLPAAHLWPVRMDPAQVDQLLTNLCVNARDAIEGVGRISIETNRVSFDVHYCFDHPNFVPGDYVLLSVSDDGCGMDRETAAKLFEPFFTTKDIGKGTGLGLAMVYGIVKQNNGFINVYSEPGRGTTFKIYLARDREVGIDLPQETPQNHQEGHGQLVLVVEDEVSILELTQRILRDHGYQAVISRKPTQALQLVKERNLDIELLITDVVMPELDGKKLCLEMSELCPNLKTLFMSGYTADVIAHRGVLDKGVNFIQKPFSARDLVAKIYQILS